ncbi:hypothetical protein HHX38_08310 [Streptomyces sp. PKU-MA01144]|uniref:hypothetical protein n=1 Tax=Streptomyces sp. PKU-MA01144 TaxID=2729138 RepID=UPI00147D5D3C|nr:hypothetical protein [Streptomyces sp. PKU-MA01144]NNJ04136.1 hypothetical protein [Streptomyces sp. PKU-MA01144]
MTQPAGPAVFYQLSTPATWSPTYTTHKATVYAALPGRLPEVVAIGTCTLRKHGEPVTVDVPDWEAGCDWDRLSTGMGPGEWVCTPRWVGEGPVPMPGV